jgi:hypothetical protein
LTGSIPWCDAATLFCIVTALKSHIGSCGSCSLALVRITPCTVGSPKYCGRDKWGGRSVNCVERQLTGRCHSLRLLVTHLPWSAFTASKSIQRKDLDSHESMNRCDIAIAVAYAHSQCQSCWTLSCREFQKPRACSHDAALALKINTPSPGA